jgi:signal transduction histidine kinase
MFSNISLKKISFLAIIFILIFTIIFSILLIQDEYKNFETNLQIDKKEHVQTQKNLKDLKSRLIKLVLSIVTLAFILFGLILIVVKIINKLLDDDIQKFLTFFTQQIGENSNGMNPDEMIFSEFKIMSKHVNEMVKKINDQRRSLENMNLSLEERVLKKTADLHAKNEQLQSAHELSAYLLESQKVFISHAVHETNTPLGVIMANIELYELENGKNRYLSKIEVALKNIFSIYDDLSYLIKKNQVQYPKRAIDLVEYLQSRIDFFKEVADQKGLEFIYDHNLDHGVISFNETKLQRVIDNNITNAIKYTQSDHKIYIYLKIYDEHIYFIISSKSSQINDTKKIFDEFYREKNLQQGFGLGLNLVKSICEEEDVKIDIESNENETKFVYIFKALKK